MVFKMPRFSKDSEELPVAAGTMEPAEEMAPVSGITVAELEVALGSLYVAPSLRDY